MLHYSTIETFNQLCHSVALVLIHQYYHVSCVMSASLDLGDFCLHGGSILRLQGCVLADL